MNCKIILAIVLLAVVAIGAEEAEERTQERLEEERHLGDAWNHSEEGWRKYCKTHIMDCLRRLEEDRSLFECSHYDEC